LSNLATTKDLQRKMLKVVRLFYAHKVPANASKSLKRYILTARITATADWRIYLSIATESPTLELFG
jgi:hypothetical protein